LCHKIYTTSLKGSVIHESAAPVNQILTRFQCRQAPMGTPCDTPRATRTEGNAGERPERRSGCRDSRGSLRSPSRAAAMVITSSLEPYSSLRSGLRSASEKSSIRSETRQELLRPGFRNHTLGLEKGKERHPALTRYWTKLPAPTSVTVKPFLSQNPPGGLRQMTSPHLGLAR
jgi:hypothetical protein